ncbi:MAG: DUF4831 family protein [Bacteroidales bacterium]|nr:DUF4831 family protein [Bacteroidales bacterium]
MKKTLIAAAVLALTAISTRAQEVTYALPKTTITVEVAYSQDIIHAGKYAKYAKELLGLEVVQKDTVVTEITQFKIQPRVEADQSKRYSVNLNANTRPALLALTEQGLVSGDDTEFKDKRQHHAQGRQFGYRKPDAKPKTEPKVKQTFYEEQIVTSVDSLGNEISDTILVEIIPVDSLFLEAHDAAEDIAELREQRYKILTGDTDASYAGEALGAALAELSRLESELLALFQPTSETVKGKAFFDIIPDREGSIDVFALDSARGPVKAAKASSDIFSLVITAEPVAEAPAAAPTKKQPTQKLVYRIPAICTVTLTDGVDEITSLRMPIYQLGLEATYPLYD